MLPTPHTNHVSFQRIYEPAEDSFLMLDTISSQAEKQFLQGRFQSPGTPSPLILEVGTGSGVILAFIAAHAGVVVGRHDVLTIGVDINRYACRATSETIRRACDEECPGSGLLHPLASIEADLCSHVRDQSVDILLFNPPYVPTAELPRIAEVAVDAYQADSTLLALSYAGGEDGMETTDRLLSSLPTLLNSNGCAYILLCAQNKPRAVLEAIRCWGSGWDATIVGSSGKQGGWEKLSILRIWRS